MYYTFNVSLCQDTFKLICFTVGMTLDMTKFCNIIPAWITLTFSQGHRIMGKLEPVQSCCCEIA